MANLGVQRQKPDAPTADRTPPRTRSDDRQAGTAQPAADSADIARASERLAQQLKDVDGDRIQSVDEARTRLARLQVDVAHDPAAVLSAFGNLSPEGVAAAFAEPGD